MLAEQEGDFDTDSRWALAWFEQYGFEAGDYGVAEILSKAKNTSVAGMVEAGILHSRAGQVRLLRPRDLPPDWDPEGDARLTTWEIVHHLVRVMELGGELAAAVLVRTLHGRGRGRTQSVLPAIHRVRAQETSCRSTGLQQSGAKLAGDQPSRQNGERGADGAVRRRSRRRFMSAGAGHVRRIRGSRTCH